MPIRFRCAYCNQLLGIARRKAGTVVRCPTCAGQVVVPTVDTADEDDKAQPPGNEPLFERSDFDDLFNAPQVQPEEPRTGPVGGGGGAAAGTAAPKVPPPRPAPAPDEDAWATHAGPDAEPPSLPPGGPARAAGAPGLVLSPARATVLTVLVVVGLAVAFGAGLVVGRFLLGGP